LAAFSGWLIAYVHGEYDPRTDRFQLHLHVLTVGNKAKAIERLRKLPLYTRNAHVQRPIVRRRLKNAATQISYYLAQGFWPAKPTVRIGGNTRRTRSRYRIPEPRHAEFLMWLDRQTFTDLVWLHGCRFERGRLVPTKKVRK
jgi:hypothetical protein